MRDLDASFFAGEGLGGAFGPLDLLLAFFDARHDLADHAFEVGEDVVSVFFGPASHIHCVSIGGVSNFFALGFAKLQDFAFGNHAFLLDLGLFDDAISLFTRID